MSDTKIYPEVISGVGCNVTHCKYHSTDDKCHAQHINIRNDQAMRESETFCGTFECSSGNC